MSREPELHVEHSASRPSASDRSLYCAACECAGKPECGCTHTCGLESVDDVRDRRKARVSEPQEQARCAVGNPSCPMPGGVRCNGCVDAIARAARADRMMRDAQKVPGVFVNGPEIQKGKALTEPAEQERCTYLSCPNEPHHHLGGKVTGEIVYTESPFGEPGTGTSVFERNAAMRAQLAEMGRAVASLQAERDELRGHYTAAEAQIDRMRPVVQAAAVLIDNIASPSRGTYGMGHGSSWEMARLLGDAVDTYQGNPDA